MNAFGRTLLTIAGLIIGWLLGSFLVGAEPSPIALAIGAALFIIYKLYSLEDQ